MTAEIFTPPSRALDANANPYPGAIWHFYATGGLTPQNVYADAALSTSLGATVTADSGGKFPAIYLDASLTYRGILKDSTGAVTLHDFDPIGSGALALLGSSTGAASVGYSSTIPTTPTITTLRALGSRRADVRDWLGMDLTGANDCASLIQDAFTQSAAAGVILEAPAGTIKLGSNIAVPDGAVFQGPGSFYMAGDRVGRLMFHIAHTGKGFTVTGATGGAAFRGFGTKRTQPTAGVGWAPTAHDWDFYTDGATDVEFTDLLLLNATKGICCTNGGGRYSFTKIWGQPIDYGIQIDYSADVSRIRDVHFWDFWSDSAYVTDYTTANGTAIYSKRNDNPDLYDIFAIFYRYGLRIGNGTGGTTSRLRGFGLGFDAVGTGLYIDAAANGSTVELHGFYAHGHATTIGSGNLIDIQGTNGTTRIYGRTDLSNAHRSAINVAGSGAVLAVNDPLVSVYNMANGGYTAVTVASGAYAELRGAVGISGGVSGTASYSGAGRISGPLIAYTPTVTAGTGAFTGSATVTYAYYSILDGWCEVFGDIVLATNNTAATDVRVSLPFAVASGITEIGIGRQVTANKGMQVQPIPGTSTAAMVYYDGTYPGATGANLTFRLRYRV